MSILFIAWQSPHTRTIHPVARVLKLDTPPHYELSYIGGFEAAQQEGFLPFLHMKDSTRVYRSHELFPLLSNRLLPSNRQDYAEYLRQLDLEDTVEPIVILARSQGRKATDSLELFGPPCFNPEENTWVHLFFARGIRHIKGAEQAVDAMAKGKVLEVRMEVRNESDPRALLLSDAGNREKVGYVPHALLDDLHLLAEQGSALKAEVVRINPPPAPIRQRLLARLSVDNQEGYIPLQTQRYQPLAKDATPFEISAKSYSC